jgi:hypothetical protein
VSRLQAAGASGGSRRRRQVSTLAVVLGVLLALALWAPAGGYGQTNEPEPYRPEEFPKVLQDLRRGEIILIGSFPFTLFLSLEVFDFYRFAINDWAPEYAPWPFRSPASPDYSAAEKGWILLSALSASAVLAIADYVVGRIVERRAQGSSPRRR